MLDLVLAVGQRGIDDVLERHDLAAAARRVRDEDGLRAREANALAERTLTEASEDDAVDRADAGAREHQRDRLDADGHRDRDAVAAVDPERSQRSGDAFDLGQQFGVREAPLGAILA